MPDANVARLREGRWILIAALCLCGGCSSPPPDSSSAEVPDSETEKETLPDAYTPTAADLPSTDIFLVALESSGADLQVGTPINITDRPGYDNQPAFTPDSGAVLYTSGPRVVGDGNEQTDIYRYDTATGMVTQITHTPASEYSPKILPDGRSFSTIHEDAASQQLWLFTLDGSDQGGLFAAVQPVGYHAWGSETVVAAFVLGNEDQGTPDTLQLIDAQSGTATVIAERIGRSLHKIPGRDAISFVHKVSEAEWWIKELDLASRETTPLVETLKGREDYAWTAEGSILMGDDTKLFAWRVAGGWYEVADLSMHGIADLSRLAVAPSGRHLALVASRQDVP